ncbi:MAG TPA: double-strand break repair helicase AddA [Stellaceae bacterium]|nr:double-strand break repair helicase AddA [Stellaceae bacterium]
MNTADHVQRQALDPAASVWVSASAGTGKTKVLTERLLTLMLDGTDPSRLLCLTFTRAAAAEMVNRVNTKLAEWTTMPAGALHQELVNLLGLRVDEAMHDRARQLFARVLDTPGGAKIATIHAFCQSLLRRFPLEAGVPPEFAVIDERSAKDALAEAGEQVIARARDGLGELAGALAVVARHAQEDRFGELMSALAAERGKLRAALDDGAAALRARLCDAFGLPAGAAAEDLTATFCDGGEALDMRGAVAALAQGSVTDRKRAVVLAAWWDGTGDRPTMAIAYAELFLTKERGIRKQLFTKDAAKKTNLDLGAVLAAEAERVRRHAEACGSAAVIEATGALATLGDALLTAYERHKALHGQLDYDDLVAKTLALLGRDGVAQWVLFKLDGGLDHILIDEAQDTNHDQWEIVSALANEFFAGEGAVGRRRTVFAVGDAKQSIYSFQRADPRAFLAMREHFQRRVTEAKQGWRIVPLDISFRAAPPLLRAIDAVFADHGAADGVALDGRPIRHVAARAGQAGLVELWPPVAAESDPGERGAIEPRTRLARAIAATIAGWLRTGERLESKGRPITPGDILVLVRRRSKFVGDLLRALKRLDVPVAGADRLQLTEQLAVQDLVALGNFLLLPEDDLTLATVLKGPLFGISEDALFRLAYDRDRQSLWRRLRRAPELSAVHERLSDLLGRADFTPPYELYAQILGAEGGRRAMLERLGAEAADPIEEFLALTLAYEREHVPSLQGFLHWLVDGDIEVKRDFGERQRDEIRIMTVHGAKGLEAPVVFVPDSMQLPDPRVALLWSEEAALPLWRPRADLSAPFYEAERAAARRRDLQEYRRLLYVALTRAQDRLYVCGWQPQRATSEAPSWYTLCEAGWRDVLTPFDFDSRDLVGDRIGWAGQGLRLVSAQEARPERGRAAAASRAVVPSPAWADRPPPAEPDPPKPLLPSRPSGAEPPTISPLADAGRDRFKRGLLVHRLLQSLPELPEAEREAAAGRFLALPMHAIPPDEQDEIRRETLGVLAEPGFAELWGPDAQAEVPVVGLIGGQALSGQIDRIVVTPDRVLIVDYKSVRPPPETPDSVAATYLRQLATYRAALRLIYPDRPVECALLWTAAPRLMAIDGALLDRHAPPGAEPVPALTPLLRLP